MAVTPEMITAVRLEVADNDPALPILSDDEITYLLNKQNESIRKASLDAARIILLKLSQVGDEVVGMMSVKGSKVAEQYRLSLELYLKNPNLNPILGGLVTWTDNDGIEQNPIFVGGVSVSDMKRNVLNTDNNYVPQPINQKTQNLPYVGPFNI